MTWFKVDDGLHSHPKWLAASPHARALWVTAGSWCASHLTDGHVPKHTLQTLCGRRKDAAELVNLGLWITVDDGWQFHDWLAFQPSAESVVAEREAARQRQRRAREKARESRRASRRDIDRESRVNHTVSHGPPDPTRPDLIQTSSDYSHREGDSPDDDGPKSSREPGVETVLAVLATRDLDARVAAKGNVGDTVSWTNAVIDRRRATDGKRIAALVTQRPSLTAEQIADLVEPPQVAQAVNGHPLDSIAAANRARTERHLRVARGEGCQACNDTGWTLDDDGNAVECKHP